MIAKFKLPYRIHFLVSLCLLLCACQTTNSPKQLLDEQVIDDTHDAFLVDTGGKLGTLLIMVESEEFELPEHGLLLHFSVWNPAHMDAPIQMFTKDSACFGWHEVMDANFDGYMDFGYTFYMGNMPYYEHLWIWDEAQWQFINVPEFDEISVPVLIEETETIYGYNRSSAGGTGLHTFHQWKDGHLTCMRQIKIEGSIPHKAVCMSIQDWNGTEMVEIYHEDFSHDSYGWHDAQKVWYNLDYHGELYYK